MAAPSNKDLPPHPWHESDAAFKERLTEEGTWAEFLLERAAYRYRGLTDEWANRFAQQHFPPAGYLVHKIDTRRELGDCGTGTYGITAAKIRDRAVLQLGIAHHARPTDFDGKTCSFTGAVDWVAENLAIKVVKADAPSKLAWSIYEWASSSPTYKAKFYELYLGRRYKPDRIDDLEGFDPGEGLSEDGEDVGLPVQPGVPDALAGDTVRPEGEPGVAEEDELARYSLGGRAEADSP